jgi:hypothetical protein
MECAQLDYCIEILPPLSNFSGIWRLILLLFPVLHDEMVQLTAAADSVRVSLRLSREIRIHPTFEAQI